MGNVFSVPVTVRGYELDVQGHLNQAVYLRYAEHSRWEALRAAGLTLDVLRGAGVGPVVLETTIRFLRELRDGDTADVTAEFEYGTGKTFRILQRMVRADGTVAAEVDAVCGVMDLTARRLVPDPAAFLRELATDPPVLGL